ncbi:MAG: class I poly(R)-hydroxyalkanoic acid synthase, partial [Neisseriaceae bacterium]|nr:class I poly(R)-hydroxyalkanoic acid synthase [Neisseriaceae bacterium]
VCGVPIDISTIDIPIYFYASETDHIVLAHSVYDGIKYFTGSKDKRFVLGESGHIAGAINPVSKNRRSYWTGENMPATYEEWRTTSENHKGSWWVDAVKWFGERSGKEVKAPTTFGNSTFTPVCDAPGEYVRAKALPALKTHFV